MSEIRDTTRLEDSFRRRAMVQVDEATLPCHLRVPAQRHRWQVIECDNVTDKVRCADCGQEVTEPCRFDDDYT